MTNDLQASVELLCRLAFHLLPLVKRRSLVYDPFYDEILIKLAIQRGKINVHIQNFSGVIFRTRSNCLELKILGHSLIQSP